MVSKKTKDKVIKMLNRTITLDGINVLYEGDERHSKSVIDALGLHDSKPVTSPSVSKSAMSEEKKDRGELMPPREATAYRSVVATLNFMALDRPDIQEATRECSKFMARPCQNDIESLKRLGRYLKGKPRVIQLFDGEGDLLDVQAFGDSNWAACPDSRISVSAGVIKIGNGVVKTWSKDQKFQSLSSAEAELYGANMAAQQAMGVVTAMNELGIFGSVINLSLDASAAIGILSRRGLGKLRHIHVNDLWLQQKLAKKELLLSKVATHLNIADIGTKSLDGRTIDFLMGLMNFQW
jgi:hypothetical protein